MRRRRGLFVCRAAARAGRLPSWGPSAALPGAERHLARREGAELEVDVAASERERGSAPAEFAGAQIMVAQTVVMGILFYE